MPKKAANMYGWRLEGHRRSPRTSAMEACKSPPAKQKDLQNCSRDFKRQQLKHVQDTAAKRIKTAEGYAHEYHPCRAEQLTCVPSISCIPDKRELELILDILQRRDTHEIFAEPVDPNEVGGYYEIIKEPMDFGTMRAKLHEGMYSSLEQFERDVFLISRNAMQFNSSATIYFRQARAIHELAKRVFNSLKTDPEGFGSKISRTRRRNSRRVQREAAVSSSSLGSKFSINTKSSCASVGESSKALLHSTSRSPDKGKGARTHTVRSSGFATYNHEVFSGDRNGESNSCTDLDRRSTYRPWTSCFNEGKAVASAISICNNSKQLMPVDLTDVSYKESLMLFAKTLGPTARRIATHKLQFASNFIQIRPCTVDPSDILGENTHSLAEDAPITCFKGELILNGHSSSYSSSRGFTLPNISGWLWESSKHVNKSDNGRKEKQ